MTKSYKEMNINELRDEIERVRHLLQVNKNTFTIKQNRKYLNKLRKEYYTYQHFNICN